MYIKHDKYSQGQIFYKVDNMLSKDLDIVSIGKKLNISTKNVYKVSSTLYRAKKRKEKTREMLIGLSDRTKRTLLVLPFFHDFELSIDNIKLSVENGSLIQYRNVGKYTFNEVKEWIKNYH